MRHLKTSDAEIYNMMIGEFKRQNDKLEMIASENFVSYPVLEAIGSIMTNKYAEGYPGNRYYGGCEFVDAAENLARDRVKELFDCEYANVQPHSGSQANMAIYMALLNPGDTVMGMDLSHGGHLTHGSPVNFSGMLYNIVSYGVSPETGQIDYDKMAEIARKHKPKMIIAGASAYPRTIDFSKFREIADEIGAFFLTDMAHIAGLVATGYHPSPLPYSDFVTSTTHKTLRGPRGGLILRYKDDENTIGKIAAKTGRVRNWSEVIDSIVMPGIQGGPLMHVVAAKAVAFGENLKNDFKEYCGKIIQNGQTLAQSLLELDYQLVSGGTDNHLVLVDLTNKGISGKKAENALEAAGITVNKNMVPFDTKSPFITSGIRIGVPALTSRNMGSAEMKKIATLIDRVIANYKDDAVLSAVKAEVKELASGFPLYKLEELNG